MVHELYERVLNRRYMNSKSQIIWQSLSVAKRMPTFEDIYQKSLDLLPDVKHFKSEYSTMLEGYVKCRK